MSLDKKLKEMITFMVNKAKTLKNYKLHSLDGEIGKVNEFTLVTIKQAPEYLEESLLTRD